MQKRKVSILLYVLIFVIILSTLVFLSYDSHKQNINIEKNSDKTVVESTTFMKYDLKEKQVSDNATPYDGSEYDKTLRRLYRIVDGKKATNLTQIKNVLFWDTFYGNENMNLGLGSDIFKRCPVNKCFTTHNRSYMPVEEFDAIIFYTARWSVAESGVPEKRKPNQKYIFFSWETAYNTYFENNYVKDFYNWTLNYRRDSDIHYPYRMFYKNDTKYQLPKPEVLKKKNKMAMWLVSNCITRGTERRQKYVDELKKYIDVDIYGKCGTMKCENTDECRKILEDNYYFYLAFENTQCLDYVTEKMYETMKYNVIPIVLGNANYENIAPKYSVIDTRDFATPKILSEYLIELKNNYSAYVEYFEWKKKYYVSDAYEYALCQLCDMLHRPLEYSSYSDIREWYFGVNSYLK